MLPKRTCEAWHKLLMYAGSEAFEMAAVKKRADVHSQEIKADKEKLLQLEIAVSRLQDEVCQLKSEVFPASFCYQGDHNTQDNMCTSKFSLIL